MNRIEVLDEVGDLQTLPNAKCSTRKQIAEFYGVPLQDINNLLSANREEVSNAGFRKVPYQEIKDGLYHLAGTPKQWKTISKKYGIGYRYTNLFPKHTILLIGFILEESNVADRVRELIELYEGDIFKDNSVEQAIDQMVDETVKPKPKPKAEINEFEPEPIKKSVQKEQYNMVVPVEEPVEEVKSTEIVVIQNNQAVTTSLQVAETFGKEVKHVNEAIKNLMVENSTVKNMFHESTYTNERGREYPMFYMNRDGFTLLAMGFTGKKAMKFKIQYINQFNQMEEQLKTQSVVPVHSYMIDNPIERAKQWIEEQQEKMVLTETVGKQVVVIEEQAEVIQHQEIIIEQKLEVIQVQAQTITEQEKKLMKATAILYEQQEVIVDSINDKVY